MPSSPVITTRRLTRHYGARVGVDAIDLSVDEGTIYGFLGPNGSGKTTAIRVLLGFLRPGAGAASVLGRDCWRESAAIKRDVGYVPGDLRLYPWMTARSALAIVGRVRGMDLRAAGADLAERFRLETTVRVRKMSRGMRQKLGLILALAHDPRVVILDEPTSGLDPLMQNELLACLRERADAGHTVFFSSHTLSEVEQLCDRVGIIRDGRIVADETLDALRKRARRSVVITFRTDCDPSALDVPPFLDVSSRRGHFWRADLDGPVPPLLTWASRAPIADLSISPPDLESLFQRYYRRDAPAEPAP